MKMKKAILMMCVFMVLALLPGMALADNDFKTVSNTVTFGTWPQTAAGTDETPIEWIVLDYDSENNRALLLSRYGLDVQPYNLEYTSAAWETCTLRA